LCARYLKKPLNSWEITFFPIGIVVCFSFVVLTTLEKHMPGISKKERALNTVRNAKNHRLAARNTQQSRRPRRIDLDRGWIVHPFGFDDEEFESGFFSSNKSRQDIASIGTDFSGPNWEIDAKRSQVNAFYSERDLKIFWSDALELSIRILRDTSLDTPSDELDFLSNQLCADICADLELDYCALLKQTATILLKEKDHICHENMRLLKAFVQLNEERRPQENTF
jgi:hypothetical protein